MADKEVNINGNVIGENSKITLTVKNALWALGLLITLFSTILTIAYFDVKSDMKTYKEKVDKDKEEFVKTIQEDITTKLEKRRDKEEEFVRSIEEMKGNIKLILDRTQRVGTMPAEGVNTINNNNPTNVPPPDTRSR